MVKTHSKTFKFSDDYTTKYVRGEFFVNSKTELRNDNKAIGYEGIEASGKTVNAVGTNVNYETLIEDGSTIFTGTLEVGVMTSGTWHF